MSVKTTQLIKCDHVHASGEPCTVERTQSKILATDPMYHLTLTLEVIDAGGVRQMVQEDVHLCYWDLYHHLSALHDQAKEDIEAAKLAIQKHEDARNNDE